MRILVEKQPGSAKFLSNSFSHTVWVCSVIESG